MKEINNQAHVLDMCCGSKMFWFDKEHKSVIFNDTRSEKHILCDGRALNISPDTNYDFKSLPFPNNRFKLVVFDPPHLTKIGEGSWMFKKYGKLPVDWKDEISKGFNEGMRVLDSFGILIFKWNETHITVSEIIKTIGVTPLFGHKSGKRSNTHWMAFMKGI